MKYILAVLQAPWGRRRCLPRTCTPRSWRPCRAGEEQLSPGRQVVGAHDVPRAGSGCSRPRSLPRCAWPGPRCSRCWGGPSSLTVRRPWGPGSALLWRPPPRRPLPHPESALRQGRLRDSELAGKEAVHLRDGVVAEQRGGDARGRRRVLVCG